MVTAGHELSPGRGSRKIQIHGSDANSGGVKCRQPLHWESSHATQVVAPPHKHHDTNGQDGEGASAPPSAALHQLQTLVRSKLCLDPGLRRPRVLSAWACGWDAADGGVLARNCETIDHLRG